MVQATPVVDNLLTLNGIVNNKFGAHYFGHLAKLPARQLRSIQAWVTGRRRNSTGFRFSCRIRWMANLLWESVDVLCSISTKSMGFMSSRDSKHTRSFSERGSRSHSSPELAFLWSRPSLQSTRSWASL